jgi:hypothetical protein
MFFLFIFIGKFIWDFDLFLQYKLEFKQGKRKILFFLK